MSWTDRKSIKHIKKIRDIFHINTFIETGTFLGINVIEHIYNFKHVYSCEKNKEYFNKACDKISNVYLNDSSFKSVSPHIYNQDSKTFLTWWIKKYKQDKRTDKVCIYLDAHFYNPKNKNKSNLDRFVVLQELKVLKGFKNAIIIIHDFKGEGLGGITYDGIDLDMKLLKKDLLKANPNYFFYTNDISSCDILKLDEVTDLDMKENLKYAWSKPEKTFRGLLYAVPQKIKIEGLREIKL